MAELLTARQARRGVELVFVTLVIALVSVSFAWACTYKAGQTVWGDNHGTEDRAFLSGDEVWIHAENVDRNVSGKEARDAYYVPATGLDGNSEAHEGHPCMNDVSYLRHPDDGKYYQYSPVWLDSSEGYHIGGSDHLVGDDTKSVRALLEDEDIGTWQLCFYESSPDQGLFATGSLVIVVG